LVGHKKCRKPRRQLDGFEPVRLTLSERGKEILEFLSLRGSPSKAAEAAGITRPTMSYWVKKLKKLGYIHGTLDGACHLYELTESGSKILTGSEEDRSVIVLEDYPVKFDVVSWGRADCLAWEKLGEPRNWVKLGFKVGSIQVVRTSRSVIVHPGRLRGDNSWNLIFVASQECNRVARWLVRNTNMVLRPGEPTRKKPGFQVYDQLAEEVTRHFTFKNQDGEGADRSPPAKKGHWELGPEAANDFIRTAGRLKLATRQLYRLKGDLEKLEDGLLPALDAWTKVGQQLLKVLARLGQMEEPEVPLKAKGKDESLGYVC